MNEMLTNPLIESVAMGEKEVNRAVFTFRRLK